MSRRHRPSELPDDRVAAENGVMEIFRITALFAVTAVAEIVGCYLPWLVLKQGKSAWLSFQLRFRWPCSRGC
jgi:hypothetical protein